MIYILIDTCSWINLLDHKEINPQLEKLNFWIEQGLVQILVPELIIKEWNEHKEDEKQGIINHWKNVQNHVKIAAKNIGNIPFSNYKLELDFIDNQFEIIDNIIHSSPHQITTTDDIKKILPDKLINPKKAPFHHKADSMKDAFIYFSTLEYCKSKQINEIYFISDNPNDFGKPLKEKKGETKTLHPDLLIDFPEIDIIYYGIIRYGINELSKNLPDPPNLKISPNNSDYSDFIQIDRNKPIFEQLIEFISKIQKETKFVPLHLLTNHYPFKKNIHAHTYHSIFTLNTDNEELINIFKSFEVTDDNSINILDINSFDNILNIKEKLKQLLIFLTRNLIFNIQESRGRETINTRYNDKKNCTCPKCNFNKLKFEDTFQSLKNYDIENIGDRLELSYVHYKIGNYLTAVENLKIVYEKAINSNLYTTAFIAKHNLRRLTNFVRNNYWGAHEQKGLIQELRAIDLQESSRDLTSVENIKLIEWIRDNRFYTESRDKIQTTVSKILDHYHSYIYGGWSSNSNVWNLINEFAQIVGFLNLDYIVYDKFREFNDLCNNFFEGIFASHAIIGNNNSRLETFDDWIMTQLLVYGEADRINKLYRRYKLKTIVYEKTSVNGDSFIELTDNFFTCNSSLKVAFSKNCEQSNKSFWEYYNKIFCNLITLNSICNFSADYYNSFSEKLLNYLDSEEYLQSSSINHIITLLDRVGIHLSDDNLKRFFHLAIKNTKYHEEVFFESLADISIKRNKRYKINDSQYAEIINMAFENCVKCQSRHSKTIIVPIYNLIQNDNFRNELNILIRKNLAEKFSFDFFYLATLFNIIELNETFLDQGLDEYNPTKNESSPKYLLPAKEENRHQRLNKTLNICFKFDIPTNNGKFFKFKGLDPYYDWLLDMDNFDYNLFEPSWISEYPTKYYYRKIGTNKKSEEALVHYLRNNLDDKVERVFTNIFIRRKWEQKTN
jgi:hypothetical protein